jgi:hypothetical protein
METSGVLLSKHIGQRKNNEKQGFLHRGFSDDRKFRSIQGRNFPKSKIFGDFSGSGVNFDLQFPVFAFFAVVVPRRRHRTMPLSRK